MKKSEIQIQAEQWLHQARRGIIDEGEFYTLLDEGADFTGTELSEIGHLCLKKRYGPGGPSQYYVHLSWSNASDQDICDKAFRLAEDMDGLEQVINARVHKLGFKEGQARKLPAGEKRYGYPRNYQTVLNGEPVPTEVTRRFGGFHPTDSEQGDGPLRFYPLENCEVYGEYFDHSTGDRLLTSNIREAKTIGGEQYAPCALVLLIANYMSDPIYPNYETRLLVNLSSGTPGEFYKIDGRKGGNSNMPFDNAPQLVSFEQTAENEFMLRYRIGSNGTLRERILQYTPFNKETSTGDSLHIRLTPAVFDEE